MRTVAISLWPSIHCTASAVNLPELAITSSSTGGGSHNDIAATVGRALLDCYGASLSVLALHDHALASRPADGIGHHAIDRKIAPAVGPSRLHEPA